ncbi:hypothetical protein [Gloeocapsa sp. PCC 73106]|uniref:DUF6930 domain-containing protein n=1 Tax=Gloeocapsa sp. PCC 73106 TaxID=102232 RepID=UPI0002AC4FED|nr:hypothetical protein [Gloeocapsa sp. PCC 73106]ELR98906.1 hypothetical protein GLO73106DRAFT_00027450 [Gloeocapsa sp. PCC 73106]
MNALPQTTMRRLKKIPQNSTVWEGDRRPLSGVGSETRINPQDNRECIIWVDAVEGLVRAMDVVPPEMGLEAIVRTLLRAIENPHGPAKPGRPQKIIVQNREIQFFLRGAIQDLNINVDYVPELPLIDELFRTFELVEEETADSISPHCQKLLEDIGDQIWREAPWNLLADHDIVALEINRWDITKLYACVMGMLGRKYGVILYRSLDSMKQFRSAVLAEESVGQLENAFLGQDCWFLSYELKPDQLGLDDEEDLDLADLPSGAIFPVYGSVHPLEGIRPLQDEEEAMAIYLGLKALLQFCRSSAAKLSKETIQPLEKRHRVIIPVNESQKETAWVTVSTMPEVTDELLNMLEEAELEEEKKEGTLNVPISEELIPQEAIYHLDLFSQELITKLSERSQTYVQELATDTPGNILNTELPVFVIQTSRPKAQTMIETIQNTGGLTGICFTQGEDTWAEITYELAIAQTGDGQLHLIGEFFDEDDDEDGSLQQWYQQVLSHQGYCGLIIAMGITGASAGDPQLKDMLGFFPIQLLDPKDLGLGVLQLNSDFSFEEE